MKDRSDGRSSLGERMTSVMRLARAALVIAGLTAFFIFRAPGALAGGLAQAGVELNEASESIEAQVGADEPDGATNDSQVNEAQEGIDELEGQNNDSQLDEGQEGVDEEDGPNNDSQENQGQEGDDESDGQNGQGEPPAAP